MSPSSDLYARVTEAIVAELEKGVSPWTKPWAAGHQAGPVSRPLRSTGEAYSGINVLLLWAQAMRRGYTAPIWITFRQALALGAHVRKGERGATVVYANRFTRTEAGEDGRDVERSIPFLRAYSVFNVEQVEGLPAHFYAVVAPRLDASQRIAHAETFFAAQGADIRHGGDQAYFAPGPDYIQMPAFESFADPEFYYATLGHEMAHWTGHTARLNRDVGGPASRADYAAEELVAEIASAFLCADLGLALEPRPDHACYIASWLRALKNDRRFIFTAGAHAQRACDFLRAGAGVLDQAMAFEARADAARAA